MGFSAGNARLRREDCEYVKHDKLFSKWKILVGPSDWREVQGIGRSSGTGRYQMRNVPAMEFGPGVLELGVTAPSWSPASQRAQPLKTQDVIPVYVGQAANIRQRLQKFGQAAAHLEPGSRSIKLYQGDEDSEMYSKSTSTSRWLVQSGGGEAKSFTGSGLRLFSDVFALGSSIAFRWAHTESKAVAEQVVAELMAVFDYAWNKGPNGTRRSRDILAKLFIAWPTTQDSRSFARKRSWLLSRRSPVGIKVALRKPHDPTTKIRVGKNLCFFMTLQPQAPFSPRRQQHDRMKRLRNTPSRNLDQRKRVNYLMRWSCFPTRAGYHVKEEQPAVERRRPCSLSFNTWVKIETDDQRVHNHGDVTDSGVKRSVGMVSKRRVRRMSSIYSLIMPADDTKRG